MTQKAFLTDLAGILIAEPEELRPDVQLGSFKGWDSMGKMQVLTLIDTDVGVSVPLNWLAECHTVGQILVLVDNNLTQVTSESTRQFSRFADPPGVVIPFNRSALEGREFDYISQAISSGQIAGDQPFSKCQALLRSSSG